MTAHGILLNQCLLALSESGAMVWRNEVGKARAFHNPQRVIAYGLVGSADIMGLHNGRALAIEVKVGSDRLRPRQCAFRDAFTRAGGLWVEARSIADALAVVADPEKAAQ